MDEHNAMPGHNSAAAQVEHDAAMNLVRDGEITHRAVRDGAWSDPGTWSNGRVPGEGAVVDIPEGRTVNYDVNSTVDVYKVRVDGTLDFATAQNTRLEVDTILVTETGRLEIGSDADPVRANVTSTIRFVDNGSVNDLSWDPQQLSRGLVSHGAVEIHGADKADHMKVTADPRAGQNQITLAEAPSGWRVGDKIVLTGTHYVRDIYGNFGGTEDEVLTVRSISGNTVGFNETLRFDHTTPDPSLKASVANLTRNVTFNSESRAVDERGHVMFMHSDMVDVDNAAFDDLGRTDKSVPLDDRVTRPDPDAQFGHTAQVISPTIADNIRGRYPVHIHRVGADPDQPAATITGSVVWGSPGWGFVSHDSHADFTDNVSYDVQGSHFVAEVGNETGTWDHNIAIRGLGRPVDDIEADTVAQDLGAEGNGFWLNGREIALTDNIAEGMRQAGFHWFNRGNEMIDSERAALDHPDIAFFDDKIESWRPAIETFTGNETIASYSGFRILRMSPAQGHDDRSHLQDFTGWEVVNGFRTSYTSNYLMEDMHFWATRTRTSTSSVGANIDRNSESLTLRDVEFDGFRTGVTLNRSLNPFFAINDNPATRDDRQYLFIDVQIDGSATAYVGRNATFDRILAGSALRPGTLSLDFDDDSLHIRRGDSHGRSLILEGTKTDSVGRVDFPAADEQIAFFSGPLAQSIHETGYWTLLDGTRVLPMAVRYSDRGTAETEVLKFIAVIDRSFTLLPNTVNNGLYHPAADVYIPDFIDRDTIPTGGTPTPDPTPDPMPGGSGGDVLTGGPGADYLQVTADITTLHGGGGDDRLTGGAAADHLYGDMGNDSLFGGGGNDVLEGGGGNDRIDGGDGNDRILGGGGENLLYGNAGNDIIYGGRQADDIQGHEGDDRLQGDAGDDRLLGGSGNDTLFGSDGNDRLYGDVGADLLDGGNGNDTIYGEEGNDRILGGAGNDTINAGTGDDEIAGGAGNDRIAGNEGADLISGGGGNDNLIGGTGNDEIYGDGGSDRLEGGDGADLFIIEAAGRYEIVDFENGVDHISIRGFGPRFDTVAEILSTAEQGPDGTVLTLVDPEGAVTEITLSISLARLGAADFGVVIA